MIEKLFAETQVASPAAHSKAPAPSPFMSFVPLLAIFVIFYFLLIRPQQAKMKQHKKMVLDLKEGNKVITSGGFYATVVNIGDTSVEVKLADNVKVKILKSAISEVLGSGEIASTANGSKNGK